MEFIRAAWTKICNCCTCNFRQISMRFNYSFKYMYTLSVINHLGVLFSVCFVFVWFGLAWFWAILRHTHMSSAIQLMRQTLNMRCPIDCCLFNGYSCDWLLSRLQYFNLCAWNICSFHTHKRVHTRKKFCVMN